MAQHTSITLPQGWQLHVYDSVGSTNDIAKDMASNGAGEGTVVWAGEQTKGRGRRERTWISPKGNLYCSTLVEVDRPLAEMGLLGFVVAVAVVEAVQKLCPDMKLFCKWPNDVLALGGKISGMLLETVQPRKDTGFVAVGLGINLANAPQTDILYPATSLKAEGLDCPLDDFLQAVLASFAQWLNIWRKQGFAPIRKKWLNHAKGLGQPIKVRLPKSTLGGVFKAIDECGALVLKDAQGNIRKIVAGDVFF